jgi:MSHA biogenesis protein MshP
MCPELKRRPRGFSLVSAIFVMLILAALAAYAASVATGQSHASALDLLGSRAFSAARAGAEWGAYQSLRLNSCAASTTIGFAGTPLAPMSASVSCTRTTADEAGTTVTLDRITSLACNQAPCPSAAPGPNYVERQLTMVVSR